MKRVYAYAMTAAVLIAAAAAVIGAVRRLPVQPTVLRDSGLPVTTVLLDAGHGGADGGAVAPDGTAEKGINLDIALRARDMLRFFGYKVRMTRESDVSLHDASAATAREQKVSDMHRRLELYNQADLVISIHQNKFGQAKYRGIQVFYSPNHPAGEPFAAVLRETLLSLLQPENTRELKRGDRSIFLLYKTTAPAVLVECGFLSNPEELANLKREEYRQELAWAMTCGVLRGGW